MNEFEIPSAMQLERLVDGELSESERCAVLMAFNQEECAESCGWRRLAIAFLEAQILREAFQQGDLAGISRLCEVEPVLHPPISPATARRKSTVSRTSNVTGSWLFGLVSCCLLAFGIGWLSGPRERPLVQSVPPVSSNPRTFEEANLEQPQPQLTAAATPVETYQTLRLVLNDLSGGPLQSVEIPIVSQAEVDPFEYINAPPSIPVAIQRELLRPGRVVNEYRQLFAVELPDGRRGVVPVSDFTVTQTYPEMFQ